MQVGGANRVYFLTDYTLTADVVITYASVGTPLVVTLKAGTWFANSAAAWLWIMLQYSYASGEVFYFVVYDDSDYLGVSKTPFLQVGPSGDLTDISAIGDTGFTTWLAPDWDPGFLFDGNGSNQFPMDGFYPYWPLRHYQKGLVHLGSSGGAQRAYAGNVGSWGTVFRETREITVNIDRSAVTYTNQEIHQWYSLWRNRWRQGKTVSMFFVEERNPIDLGSGYYTYRTLQDILSEGPSDNLEGFANSSYGWISQLAQCDQLEWVEEAPTHMPQRTVSWKDMVSFDGPYKFQLANVGGATLRGSRKLWNIVKASGY